MAFNENEVRGLVIEAGHRLLEKKLIARTWGNISARLSDTEFIVTPSGRAYDTLRPEELVKVKLADLSYEGDVKPSSEKGIHAYAYLLRPEVNFVIHTHQLYASAVGAEGESVDGIPCATYGLPGTKKLKNSVALCLAQNPGAKSFLMEKHGALCLGESFEAAFRAADELEVQCRDIFTRRVGSLSERYADEYVKAHNTLPAYIDDFAQLVGASARIDYGTVMTPESDDAEAVEMIVNKNCAAALYVRRAKPLSAGDALLQRAVYVGKYSKLKDR